LLTDATVVKTDAMSHVTEEALTIRACTKLDQDQEVPLLSPATQLDMRLDGKRTVFTINGAPASAGITTSLLKMISLRSADMASDYDAMYDPPTPPHVGQSWPINAAAVAQLYNRWGYDLRAEDVCGTVKLDDVEQCDDLPCLKLELDLQINRFVRQATSQPAESYSPAPSSRSIHEQWILPIAQDKTIQRFSRTVITNTTIDGRTAGRAYHVEEVFKQATEGRTLQQP
jgi:hypothetical protein